MAASQMTEQGALTSDDAFLRVERLSYRARNGAAILDNLSCTIACGERVALVGVNGAGKTTTLRCLARVLDSWTGRVALAQRDLRDYRRKSLAQIVAFTRQFSDSCEYYNAREIVELGRLPFQAPLASLTEDDKRVVRESLERVGALRFAERKMDSLSGGERQKIFIAALFAQEPELLLLDEPTTFLDYRNQTEISDAIEDWLVDRRATALETTHDLNRAVLNSDRVIALRAGKIVYDDLAKAATSRDALRKIFQIEPPTAPHPESKTPMILPTARRKRVDAPANRKSIGSSAKREPTDAPLSDGTQNVSQAATSERQSFFQNANRARSQFAKILTVFIALALLALVLFPLLGKTSYSPDVWLRYPTSACPLVELDARAKIFWGERLPKTALAALAGAGLALAGLTLQTLFRNPLATPYTLGIASGASFGATTVIEFSATFAALGVSPMILGLPRVVWGAGAGAALAAALVYALSQRAQTQDRVLLAGVATGFFFSSLVLCGQNLANPTKTHVAMRWTTGSLELCEGNYLITILLATAVAACVLFRYSRELDALLLGEERAAALGVDVGFLRRLLFILSSALVGVIVAFCGPIGFVGLTVPHTARLFVGNSHARLIPATLLGGAFFLATCHTFARIVVFPSSIPVGVVTSLLGGPFFIWLLLNKRSA